MSNTTGGKRPTTNGRPQKTTPTGKVAGTTRTSSSTPSRPLTKGGSTAKTSGGATGPLSNSARVATTKTSGGATGSLTNSAKLAATKTPAGSAKLPVAGNKVAGTSGTRTTSTGSKAPGPKTAAARQSIAISNQERKRRARRQAEMQQRMPLFLTVGGVVAIILVFVLISHFSVGSSPTTPANATIVKEVSNVPTTVLAKVNTGGVSDPLQPLSGNAILTTSKGLPRFIYVGAGYCPYCAAERWSMVVALSRFGTFTGLEQIASSSTDVYPSTNTLSFEKATYTSKYLDATLVEETNADGTPIATPAPDVSAIFAKYDAPPYVSSSNAGGIPFIDIGNQYITLSSGYSPQLLAGLSWNDIAAGLSDPNNTVTQAIVGNANYLTAAICQITKQQPASVCQAAPIQALVKTLPAGK